MKPKKRYIARLDQVTITRKGSEAIIAYKEPAIPTTHLEFGENLRGVSDEEILASFNESLKDEANGVADYRHIAVETPLGSPQIRVNPKTNKACVHGNVLRCIVTEGDAGQVLLQIDERKLDMKEFGRLLESFLGWGVRMEFVPKNAIDRRPELQVRDLGPA